MIIGKKRQEVIFNIKRCVKEKKFNAKVEPDDPVLSKKYCLKLVEKFWANHNSPFSKAINILARRILNVGTPLLTLNTKIDNLKSLGKISSAIITCNHYN